MDKNLNYVVHTFGCKVNTYDSGLIQKNLSRNGFSIIDKLDKSKAQIHVLNTCAVTAEATQEAVKTIRRIKAKQPFSTIVVTGCSAQVDTGYFENLPGADIVVANSHKGLLPDILDKYFKNELTQKVFKSNIFKKEDLEAGGGEEKHHTRSFLKIQDGCNSFCTYCIIPYARGKSRSIPINELVRRINEFTKQGISEVVLTGVHIGDYEDVVLGDKKSLEDLIETILLKTTIPRIRLSSLEPVELTDRLVDLYSDSRLCPHFHMSIQSANTDVLAAMKRKYTQEDVRQSLNTIHNKIKNAFVGMDVITGFPTETDHQFEDTYKTLADLPWTKLHVFPYSERQGTRAADLPQIHYHIRKERGARLRELGEHRYLSEMKLQVGWTQQALLLKNTKTINSETYVETLTRHYWPVYVKTANVNSWGIGTEKTVSITSLQYGTTEQDDVYLIGEVQ